MSISEELEQAQNRDTGKAKAPSEAEAYRQELDAVAQKLYTLTKDNQGIERRVKTFEQLDCQEREGLRENIRTNSALSVQLNQRLLEYPRIFR